MITQTRKGQISKRELAEDAKHSILDGIINAANFAEEGMGNVLLAEAIRKEGARIAKRYGIGNVGGLPETFVQ